jgi:hypothetical protein
MNSGEFISPRVWGEEVLLPRIMGGVRRSREAVAQVSSTRINENRLFERPWNLVLEKSRRKLGDDLQGAEAGWPALKENQGIAFQDGRSWIGSRRKYGR